MLINKKKLRLTKQKNMWLHNSKNAECIAQ